MMTDELVALNAEVAEKLMGWKMGQFYLEPNPVEFFWNTGWTEGKDELSIDEWRPSTSISDAWLVVERIGMTHIELIHWGDSDSWQCNIGGGTITENYQMPQDGWCDTAPEAICRAALEAVK